MIYKLLVFFGILFDFNDSVVEPVEAGKISFMTIPLLAQYGVSESERPVLIKSMQNQLKQIYSDLTKEIDQISSRGEKIDDAGLMEKYSREFGLRHKSNIGLKLEGKIIPVESLCMIYLYEKLKKENKLSFSPKLS